MVNEISESIFDGRTTIIPMADVQHIVKYWAYKDENNETNYRGIQIITKHTRWDFEKDGWLNSIYLERIEADEFLKAWCAYRAEFENITNQHSQKLQQCQEG